MYRFYFILLISIHATCQTDTYATFQTNSIVTKNSIIQNYGLQRSNDNDFNLENVKGTPFLVEDFQKADLSNIEKDLLVRYNAYKDLFQIKIEDDIFYLDKSKTNLLISIKNDGNYKSYLLGNNKYSYFKLVTNNTKINLLQKNSKTIKKAEPAKNSYSSPTPSRYSKVSIKQYLAINNVVKEFKVKEKELYKLFPEFKDEIKKEIKKSGLKIKENKDLVKIINFIDSIL